MQISNTFQNTLILRNSHTPKLHVTMKNLRAHLYIEGVVQGVFYRAFVMELALKSGLKGWVKNLPDGRVEAVFEGKEKEVEKAIAECYKGPPGAHVTNIDVARESYKGESRDFEIRY